MALTSLLSTRVDMDLLAFYYNNDIDQSPTGVWYAVPQILPSCILFVSLVETTV